MAEAALGGGLGLAASILPRRVYVGATVVEVRLPTVREALGILALVPGYLEADDSDVGQMEALLQGWLPAEVLEDLEARPPQERVASVVELLNRGVPSLPKKKKKKTEDATPASYMLLLADYVQVYGGEAWSVLNTTPWPFFVHALMLKDAASCRELVRWASLAVLPNGGKGATRTLKSLERRAKGDVPKGGDGHGASAPAEVIERERAELRALLGGGHEA